MMPATERNKIVIVFVVLVVLLAGIFIIRERRRIKTSQTPATPTGTPQEVRKPDAGRPAIIARAAPAQVSQNTASTVTFYISAPGKKIFGSDLVILYDPEYLSANEPGINGGDYFTSVPRKTVDQANGIIKITAINGRDEVLGEAETVLASVNFTPLKAGSTSVGLSFQSGETNTTTLTERETSRNILEIVKPAQITIQ